MTRFLVRALVRGVFILAMIPVLLGFLLASESVNRWLCAKAETLEPRLELGFEGGDFWHGWDFSRIAWRDTALDLQVDTASLRWSPSCLFGKTLCIDRLTVERIVVVSQPGEEAQSSGPLSLPEVQLPLGLELGEVHLGELSLDGETALLSDVDLVARGSGDQLVIERFSGAGPQLDWQLYGSVQTRDDWPLELTADLNLPPVDDRDWALQARASGTLRELELRASSRGYLPGKLNASANLFEPGIPVDLRWQGEPFLALGSLPASLTLNNWQLQLLGNLEEGYLLQSTASLPGEGGTVLLEVDGEVTTTGVPLLAVQMHVADAPARRLALQADASWQQALEANAELALDAFPWQWLYPVDTGEVVLQQLAMAAHLRGEELNADLQARLAGVAGQQVNLKAGVAGTQQQLRVTPLEILTAAGQANGEVDLTLEPTVRWDGRFQLQGIDPAVFVAALPGDLNGQLSSRGHLKGEQLRLEADWDISGSLRQQPLALSGRLEKPQNDWLLQQLRVRQGANSIDGRARWGERVDGRFDLQLDNLATLWPGLKGSLDGYLQLGGDSAAPQLASVLRGAGVGLDGLQVESLNVDANTTLNEQLPLNLTVTGQGIRSDDTQLGDLQLTLRGRRAAHELLLSLKNGVADADLALGGALDDTAWRGTLTRGELGYEQFQLVLQDKADIDYRLGDGRLQLSGHCWQQASASLCFNGQQTLMPERKVDLSLNNFDLAELQAWLPDDLRWQGLLNGQVELAQTPGRAPVGQVTVSSENGVIQVRDGQELLDFPYQQLSVDTRLQDRVAKAQVLLSSEIIGQLAVNADIADPAGAQTLSGDYQLSDLKLDFLRPMLPDVDELQLTLNGSGSLSGVLSQPVVSGVLSLRDGLVAGRNLPISLEQLQADIRIDGTNARVDSRWTSGEQGQGTLSGQVGWAPLDVDLQLRGSALPVNVEPYAQLQVAPDLAITLRDNNLHVGGELAIPEGDIRVRELPASAVTVSPDVVIVGQEAAEQEAALGITARVKLNIGDQLRLSAFGLRGRLKGQLEVQENLTANGDLQILDGEFRRLGQELKLRRALLLFSGPISQPYLNVEAIRRVDDVIAGLRITGNATSPTSEVFSEPGMSQQEAMSYLVLGRPLGEEGDNNLLAQAALGLGLAGGAPITRGIGDALGLEDFAVEAEGSGNETQVVASGSITDKLSVRYGVGVFEPANQLALRYELTRRLYLEAVSGFASSLDFFYRIDF